MICSDTFCNGEGISILLISEFTSLILSVCSSIAIVSLLLVLLYSKVPLVLHITTITNISNTEADGQYSFKKPFIY